MSPQMSRLIQHALLYCGVLHASVGCVQMHPTRSGFISDYSRLRRVESHCRSLGRGDARLIRSARPSSFANVDSFYIEPVVWLADDLGQPASSADNAEQVVRSLETALSEQLCAIRPIVKTLGPRTAIVRSSVTGVQESKTIVNVITLALSGPLFNGGAAVEIEIVDQDGTQLAAESVAVQGREWEVFGFFHKPRHAVNAVRRAAVYVADDLELAR